MSTRQAMITTILIALCFVVTILSVGYWQQKHNTNSEIIEQSFQQNKEEVNEDYESIAKGFWQDHEALKKNSLFQYTNKRDAGELFNSIISYETNLPQFSEYKEFKAFLKLPKTIPTDLQTFRDLKLQSIDISPINDSWFAKLARFDHWDITRFGPLSVWNEKDRYDYDAFNLPSVDLMNQMRIWSQLHLEKARRKNKVESASKQIHKLAQLLFSQESIIAKLVAISILRDEHELKQKWNKNGSSFANWKTYSKKETNRMQRFFLSANIILQPLLSEKNLQQLSKLEVGRCMAISNAAPTFLQNYRMVYEKTVPKFYSFLDNWMNTSTNCRLYLDRKAWKNADYTAFHMKDKSFYQEVLAHSRGPKERKLASNQKMDIYYISKHKEYASQISKVLLSIKGPKAKNYYKRYAD